jgi:hypothetical protein
MLNKFVKFNWGGGCTSLVLRGLSSSGRDKVKRGGATQAVLGNKVKQKGVAQTVLVGSVTFLILFVLSFLMSSVFLQGDNSEATDITVSATLAPALTVSAPSTCSLGSVDVVNSTLATCNLVTTVSTNNPTGYTLSMNTVQETSTGNDNTCLRHASTIPPAAGTPTACASYLLIRNSHQSLE